ncbi:MAG: ceramidase domain-containing protein [Dongiaceae bacterium]
MDGVDLYCERVGAEFWAEPINALTNAVFILAAWGAWHTSRRSSTLSPGIWLLLATAVAIGIGSFVFHTVATSWARVLDVVPILIFQLLFLWLYERHVIALTQPISGLLLAGFLVAAFLGRQFSAVLNGSLIYAPAFLAFLALGLYHARTAAIGRFDLLAAAGVLSASLFFRTIDNTVCSTFPIGTHFLWHLSNGAVVYLAIRSLVHRSLR